jgi:DNA gyrase subunit B
MTEKKSKSKKKSDYGAEDIYVLEGLDPVRRRPGMYIGSTGSDGFHHLIWEVMDNSIDEAMAGYADTVILELLPNNEIRVTDNGRGIPVEKHKQTGKSALETVLTTLHAGGKFGGDSYKVAGGLHGVGVSVVNALSEYLIAEVYRDGKKYTQEYKKGVPQGSLKKSKGEPDKTGTVITFKPDEEIFTDSARFNFDRIINHLRQQAYLTKGLKIDILDKRSENVKSYGFYFEGGLKSYLSYLIGNANVLNENPFYVHKEQDNIDIEATFVYTDDVECEEHTFANNIDTIDGGMHLTGFRSALTRSLNDYARKEGILKKTEENFSGQDVREGLVVAVSIKLSSPLEPQFEGQTKARLGNPEARSAVESVVNEALAEYLDKHSNDAKIILKKNLLAVKARKAAKAAKDTVLRKGALDSLSLPGKLADCISKKPEESELFIVEGDSAGGSAKGGRDKKTQAILPLRGKILNVEKTRIDKMLKNREIKSLIIALGTAISDSFDISGIRYEKIVIMTDADVDGAHIRTLLLTLFYRYFKGIIDAGFLYIAKPPLYQLTKGKRSEYAYSEDERIKIEKEMGNEGINVQRYKGLGEMNPDQLWETTMNPDNRILKKVKIEDAAVADNLFDVLMGGDVKPRKKFIKAHAKAVKNLDI